MPVEFTGFAAATQETDGSGPATPAVARRRAFARTEAGRARRSVARDGSAGLDPRNVVRA